MADINETILILIPKVEEPKDVTHFLPINLCRVLYKIIAKVWANRLKLCLHRCITQNQSAYVLGRMIHDNALIMHELMHYLLSSKNGSNKGFVAKLNMSKAYDRVEWNFLEWVLIRMGFEGRWVHKILDCVRIVKYMVKCNSCLSEIVVSSRGLRQGDPLSLYLFLFCMTLFRDFN